jgi:hypothetical protein
VYITTTTRSPCAFSSDEWRTVPFLLQQKLPIDELVDILLYLPRCLVIETRLNDPDADSDRTARRQLTEKLADLLKQPIDRLSAWWSKHYHDQIMDIPSSLTSARTDTAPSTEAFTSPLAATSIAYYYSAKVVATCLSDLVAPSEQSYEILVHDISVILSTVKYHRVCGPFSGGTFMMIYPIKVALFRSPCPDQRAEITQALLDWGRERGVEGVCSSGAPLWHQPGRLCGFRKSRGKQ